MHSRAHVARVRLRQLNRCSGRCFSRDFVAATHTHTHTRLTALCPGLPVWAGTRKVKPIWILLKQETVSGSGISWAVCKSAPRSRQISTPAPPPLRFLQAGCPSCRPTNSVKALKANVWLVRVQSASTGWRQRHGTLQRQQHEQLVTNAHQMSCFRGSPEHCRSSCAFAVYWASFRIHRVTLT